MDHLGVYALAERLHRQFLDVIQLELDRLRIRDLNSIRAMLLYHIGDAELTVSELIWGGFYQGANVSYNLKKLIEAGYVVQVRSSFDKRVLIVKNTEKSEAVRGSLQALIERHSGRLAAASVGAEEIASCSKILRSLQDYWSRAASPSSRKIDAAFAA